MRPDCVRGHAFTKENTYRTISGIQCRACRKLAKNKHNAVARKSVVVDVELTPTQRRRLAEALADGVTTQDCAVRFGISRNHVRKLAGTMV